MKRKLNEWQYGIELTKHPPWRYGFHPTLTIWCVKITSFPEEGEELTKKNYKGFFRRYVFGNDIIVTTRVFLTPVWLRKVIPVLKQVYIIPIKLNLRKLRKR